MEKRFDKKQFNTKLIIQFAFWGAILLIGIVSFILAENLKGAAYNHDPKNYYGYYEGYDYNDNQILLYINWENATLIDDQTQITYNYRYMSSTRVKEDYGREDGCACLFLYEEETPNMGIFFWLYDIDGEIFVREKVSGIKLTYIALDD